MDSNPLVQFPFLYNSSQYHPVANKDWAQFDWQLEREALLSPSPLSDEHQSWTLQQIFKEKQERLQNQLQLYMYDGLHVSLSALCNAL